MKRVVGVNKKTADLPPIPNKRYFTIGEVGQLCCLQPHVLRYWEQEFSVLAPTKRRGNRRYYQQQDIELVRNIRRLLYEEGYTLQGAKAQLKQKRCSNLNTTSHPKAVEFIKSAGNSIVQPQEASSFTEQIIDELESISKMLLEK